MNETVNRRPLLHHGDQESDQEHNSYDDDDSFEHIETEDVLPLCKPRIPMDRYNLAYLIFYLLGMTTVVPWNYFITADSYWMYKLRNVTEMDLKTVTNRTTMQAEFVAYLSVASTVPNTLVLVLNTLLSHRISLEVRMVGSLGSIIMLFIVTTVLVKVDTDLWQEAFFGLTLSIVVLLNIASAVMGGGLFGIVGKFSSCYITAVVSGQALGGIVAALAEISSLWLGASPVNSAFVYFMAANVMLLFALISYMVLSRTIFFQHHMGDNPEPSNSIQGRLDETDSREICYKQIFYKIWVYGFALWLTFFVTLAAYPSVTVLISSMEKGNGRQWNDVYFVPVVGYLLFSSCDYAGRILAGYLQRPRNKGWLLALLSFVRILLVPLLLLCNAHPRQHLPVVFDNDLYYVLLITMFAFTNGYLANITMICVPKIVDPREQEMASSMMATFLGIGLACGSAMGLLMVKLI